MLSRRRTNLLLNRDNRFSLPYIFDPSTHPDGELPSTWSGTTWAVSGGVVKNIPTEGSELFTDSGLENWSSSTNLTSWTEQINGTSTVNQETSVTHSGSNAARLNIDASNSNAVLYQPKSGLSQHKWYNVHVWAKSSVAGKSFHLWAENEFRGVGIFPITTNYKEYVLSFLGTSLSGGVFENYFYNESAASSSIYFDDISLKEVTTSALFATLNAGQSNVTVKAAWTIETGSMAGVIMNVDNPDNPQNFVLLLHKGDTGLLSLYKCVNGVYSAVLAHQAASYSAGANVELRKTGATTYQLWYNGVQIGADQTINEVTINNNTYHGIFSTSGGSSLNRFYCGVGADIVSVPNGVDLTSYIRWVSPGDILNLANGGSYTLGAEETGISSLFSGTVARRTKILGNGSTITGGTSGMYLLNKSYIDIQDLNFRDQTGVSAQFDGCDFVNVSNCTYGSNVNPGVMTDILKVFRSDDCTFTDCEVIASQGGNSLDGIEFWGPCNRIVVRRCTVSNLSGGGSPDHHGFEVYAGDGDDICNDILFDDCDATNLEVGFSVEGGPNSIAHTNIRAVNCTATGCDFDAQGIQGSTLNVTAGTLLNRNGSVSEI